MCIYDMCTHMCLHVYILSMFICVTHVHTYTFTYMYTYRVYVYIFGLTSYKEVTQKYLEELIKFLHPLTFSWFPDFQRIITLLPTH